MPKIKSRVKLVKMPDMATIAKYAIMPQLLQLDAQQAQNAIKMCVIDALNQCAEANKDDASMVEFDTVPLQTMAEVLMMFIDDPADLERAIQKAAKKRGMVVPPPARVGGMVS